MTSSIQLQTKYQPKDHLHSLFQSKARPYFTTSPKNINYNSAISEGTRAGIQYRTRKCRQYPQLKLKPSIENKPRAKFNSYIDLKEMMKNKIEKESLKVQYEKCCEVLSDSDIIDKLRTELKFFPTPTKISPKSRYDQKKKVNCHNLSFKVSGRKVSKQIRENEEQMLDNLEMYDMKLSDKYRSFYVSKEVKKTKKGERDQISSPPLTGWT